MYLLTAAAALSVLFLPGEVSAEDLADAIDRGRHLNQIEKYGVKGLNDKDLQAIDNNCGAYEYDLKLHVDSHLYLILDPKEEALSAGCQTLVFHASDMEI